LINKAENAVTFTFKLNTSLMDSTATPATSFLHHTDKHTSVTPDIMMEQESSQPVTTLHQEAVDTNSLSNTSDHTFNKEFRKESTTTPAIQHKKVESCSPFRVLNSTRITIHGANKIHLFNSNTMEDFLRHLLKLMPVRKPLGMKISLSTISTEKLEMEAN
jgi:hypothetical protein